jgi:hypothetical protein
MPESPIVYYTSTSPVYGKMTLNQYIETDVEERGNFTLAYVQNWMKKYNLSGTDLAIWVSPKKWVANMCDSPIPTTSCGASWLPVSQNTYRILHRLEIPPARRYYVPFLTQFGFTCNRDRTAHELSRPYVP